MARPVDKAPVMPVLPTMPALDVEGSSAPVAPPLVDDGKSDASAASAPAEVVKAKGPIKVKALRAGFFKQSRRKVDDEFFVDSEEQIGTWMKKI